MKPGLTMSPTGVLAYRDGHTVNVPQFAPVYPGSGETEKKVI